MSKKNKQKQKHHQPQTQQTQQTIDDYVYQRLNEKQIEDTNIEKLLDITIEEVREQANIEQSIDNRVGLLMALWGVLITILLDGDRIKGLCDKIACMDTEPLFTNATTGVFCIITIICLIMFGFLSIAHLYEVINIKGHKKFDLKNKTDNYKYAVDDKNDSITRMLESYTDLWIENENTIAEKAKIYRKAVISIAVFTFGIAAACILNQF